MFLQGLLFVGLTLTTIRAGLWLLNDDSTILNLAGWTVITTAIIVFVRVTFQI